MAKASEVLKIARAQIGVKESPANSNRQKYGRDYGMNGVFWCAQYVWWCAWKADGKKSKTIAHSASAAYIHEETISKCGGKWVMKKNRSINTRKAYAKKAKGGDIVSFDFGRMDAYRDHVGMVDHVEGSYIYCLEGNTTPDGKNGSQSNGGMVALKKRHYKAICAATRPAYEAEKPSKPKPYSGIYPTLPKRGWFQRGDKGDQVKLLQKLLNWAVDWGLDVDGEIGADTVQAIVIFQKRYGLKQDGGFGTNCLKKAKTIKK